jgi:hypothetical protein
MRDKLCGHALYSNSSPACCCFRCLRSCLHSLGIDISRDSCRGAVNPAVPVDRNDQQGVSAMRSSTRVGVGWVAVPRKLFRILRLMERPAVKINPNVGTVATGPRSTPEAAGCCLSASGYPKQSATNYRVYWDTSDYNCEVLGYHAIRGLRTVSDFARVRHGSAGERALANPLCAQQPASDSPYGGLLVDRSTLTGTGAARATIWQPGGSPLRPP